jgi:hypothetical protein
MPRSERCRIRGNCLDGIALPSPAQAPVADGAPGAGQSGPRPRTAHRAGASRTGLSPSGDRWRVWAGSGPAVEALRTAARHGREQAVERQGRTGRRSGPGRPRVSWGLGGPRGLMGLTGKDSKGSTATQTFFKPTTSPLDGKPASTGRLGKDRSAPPCCHSFASTK